MTDHTPMLLEKYCIQRSDIYFTTVLLQGRLQAYSVQCLNSTQDSTILIMVLEAVM